MKNQAERIRRAALKRAGIAVCDLRCRTCTRAICTGASEIRMKAEGGRMKGGAE